MPPKSIHVSKLLSLMLRHRPEEFNVAVDQFGFASLDAVLEAVQKRDGGLSLADIEAVVYDGEKQRFEIVEGRIRARYGHSFSIELGIDPTEPPEFLYKGAEARQVDRILKEGMVPFDRDHLHLSFDADVAAKLGTRPGQRNAVIRIDALRAHRAGIHFYDCGPTILTKDIPADFLSLEQAGDVVVEASRTESVAADAPTDGPVTYGRRRRFSSGRK